LHNLNGGIPWLREAVRQSSARHGGRALPKLFSLPTIFPQCIHRFIDDFRGNI
jgi:hypothetical protein